MHPKYDNASFPDDYCADDAAKLAKAIQAKASVLAIGMPGCGKSRLCNFLFNRPDILRHHGVSTNLQAYLIDCNIVNNDLYAMYLELFTVLSLAETAPSQDISLLKSQIRTTIQQLNPKTDVVIVFDDLRPVLQQALGADFFNFLHALRGTRPNLNLSYIFMTNLQVDLGGFYQLDRLFNQGVDNSIVWLSLLNEKDSYFSIERQWSRFVDGPLQLNDEQQARLKHRIYALSGGHALLMQRLTNLIAIQDIPLDEAPAHLLENYGLDRDCEKIWQDLDGDVRDYLIDMLPHTSMPPPSHPLAQKLHNYGVLQENRFFSPLFRCFVEKQEKSKFVDIHCDIASNKVILRTSDDREVKISLTGLTAISKPLFCYLATNHPDLCTKDDLIAVGWPSDQFNADGPLRNQIDRIKRWLKTQEVLAHTIRIETVFGEGYRLIIGPNV